MQYGNRNLQITRKILASTEKCSVLIQRIWNMKTKIAFKNVHVPMIWSLYCGFERIGISRTSLPRSIILDLRSYWPELKKITNFKYNCNEKSINLTSPIRLLLAKANRISSKVTDCAWFIRCHGHSCWETDLIAKTWHRTEATQK